MRVSKTSSTLNTVGHAQDHHELLKSQNNYIIINNQNSTSVMPLKQSFTMYIYNCISSFVFKNVVYMIYFKPTLMNGRVNIF